MGGREQVIIVHGPVANVLLQAPARLLPGGTVAAAPGPLGGGLSLDDLLETLAMLGRNGRVPAC
jgi:hypothetical protein